MHGHSLCCANNACVACAAGFENDAGDDASGSDTICTAITTTTTTDVPTTTVAPTTTTATPSTTAFVPEMAIMASPSSSRMTFAAAIAGVLLLCCVSALYMCLLFKNCKKNAREKDIGDLETAMGGQQRLNELVENLSITPTSTLYLHGGAHRSINMSSI